MSIFSPDNFALESSCNRDRFLQQIVSESSGSKITFYETVLTFSYDIFGQISYTILNPSSFWDITSLYVLYYSMNFGCRVVEWSQYHAFDSQAVRRWDQLQIKHYKITFQSKQVHNENNNNNNNTIIMIMMTQITGIWKQPTLPRRGNARSSPGRYNECGEPKMKEWYL